MRSILFVALTLCLSAAPAYSVEHEFSLGAGFNFNTIDTEGELGTGVDEEISIDLAIAAKEVVKLNDLWSFRTGLWFQQKSAKYSIDVGSLDGSVTANTLYASIPLNLQYQANKDIAIFGGYIADIRINDYCDADGDVNSCSIDEDSQSIVNVATLGVTITGSKHWNVDLSWQHGLTDTYKDAIKIHTFQAMAFYKF